MQKLFEEFINESRAVEGKSEVTINNYRDVFELLIKYKPDIQLADLKKKLMVDFFVFLQERERKVGNKMIVRNLKNSSLETRRNKLNAFLEWLKKNKHIKKNPLKGMKHAEVSYTDKPAYSQEEFDKIFIAASRDIKWPNDVSRKRNIAMIMFLVGTGVRKNEFLELMLKDIDMKKREVTVRGETSKSKRDRSIPIIQELIPFIKEYYASREDYTNDALWISSTKDTRFTKHGMKHLIKLLSRETGINCHLHRFRHTFAVNYYRQTHDLVGLNKLMGHKGYKQTLSYLRSLTDDDVALQMNKVSFKKFM